MTTPPVFNPLSSYLSDDSSFDPSFAETTFASPSKKAAIHWLPVLILRWFYGIIDLLLRTIGGFQ